MRRELRAALSRARPAGSGRRLIGICAGDGRDALPVLADGGRDVRALLVEFDEAFSYRQSTRGDLHELEKATGTVFERLLGLLLRSTHTDETFEPLISGSATE